MATMEPLHLYLANRNRVAVRPPFAGNASWFDLMMHAIGLTDSEIIWDYPYINQLENQHHRCMAILCRGGVDELAILLDEMVQMFNTEMLRHTLLNMHATNITNMTWTDHSMAFEASERPYGWYLILPNVITQALAGVMHELPLRGTHNEGC
jgi:hypothetical protein